jgi:hypothetical protein
MTSLLLEVTGLGALAGGVYLLLGPGAALALIGIVLLAIGLLLDQPTPKKE